MWRSARTMPASYAFAIGRCSEDSEPPENGHFDEVQEEAEKHGCGQDRGCDGDGEGVHFDPPQGEHRDDDDVAYRCHDHPSAGQRLPKVPTFPDAVQDRLTTENEGNRAEGLQLRGAQAEKELPDQQRAGAKGQETKAHRYTGFGQLGDLPHTWL